MRLNERLQVLRRGSDALDAGDEQRRRRAEERQLSEPEAPSSYETTHGAVRVGEGDQNEFDRGTTRGTTGLLSRVQAPLPQGAPNAAP